MDENFLDMTGSTGLFGDGVKIANELREHMKNELGLREYNKNAAGVAIYIRDNQLHVKQWQCQLPVRTHSAAVIAKEA